MQVYRHSCISRHVTGYCFFRTAEIPVYRVRNLAEFFNFVVFPHKGFHHSDAPQIFLNDIVQFIVGLKYPFKNRMCFARQ